MFHVPEGMSALNPTLVVDDAIATIKSYEAALGAKLGGMMKCPQTGKVAHAFLIIEGCTLFIADAFPDFGIDATAPQHFFLYLENVDQAYAEASSAGWTGKEEPVDMFWGDRVGTLQDINGNTWKLAQKVRDVSPEEMQEAMEEYMASSSPS